MACRKIRSFPCFSHDFPTSSGDLFPYFPKFVSIFLICSYIFIICSNKIFHIFAWFPIYIHHPQITNSSDFWVSPIRHRPSFRSTWAIIRRRNNSSSTGIWAQKKPTWLGNPPINNGKKRGFLYGKIIGKLWEPKLNGGFIAGKFHL